MFLQVCVILFRGRGVCLSECWDTTTTPPPRSRHPPGADNLPPGADHHPPEQTHSPGVDTPWSRKPPPRAGTPLLEQTPPGSRHPPRADTPHPPGADTPPPPPHGSRHTHTPLEQTPPGSRLQHTVNERLVRILLECILVAEYFCYPLRKPLMLIFPNLCILKETLMSGTMP